MSIWVQGHKLKVASHIVFCDVILHLALVSVHLVLVSDTPGAGIIYTWFLYLIHLVLVSDTPGAGIGKVILVYHR